MGKFSGFSVETSSNRNLIGMISSEQSSSSAEVTDEVIIIPEMN